MSAAFAAMLAASMPMAYAQTMHKAPAATDHTGAAPAPSAAGDGGTGANAGGAATTGAANAEATDHSAAKTAAADNAAEVHLGQGQMLFSKMSGATVYDEQNKDIGDINNVVLDPNGKVAAVVIKSGGFLGLGGKTFAVPMSALKLANTSNGNPRFQLNMTQEQVKTAPTFDLNPKTETGSSTAPAGRTTGSAGAGNGTSR